MNTDIIENLPGEEWRDIEGYLGLYQVSNKGRVKSLERIDSNNHPIKEKILKPGVNQIKWRRVRLCKNGKSKMWSVHRLVALAFIPNPNNYPVINHRDEDGSNNNVENLEWCTVTYNYFYGTSRERARLKCINNPKTSKPVKCLDLETNEITYYPSCHEVERKTNISRAAIYHNIKTKYPYKNRYMFSYE